MSTYYREIICGNITSNSSHDYKYTVNEAKQICPTQLYTVITL